MRWARNVRDRGQNVRRLGRVHLSSLTQNPGEGTLEICGQSGARSGRSRRQGAYDDARSVRKFREVLAHHVPESAHDAMAFDRTADGLAHDKADAHRSGGVG
jgi:hypothetical protein